MAKDKQKTRYPGIRRLGPRRYEIRFRVKDPRSTKLKEARRVREGVTIVEALDLQRAWRQEAKKAGELGTEQRITVAQYAESWMRSKAPSLRVGPARRYALALDNYVIPKLGHYYVDGLNPMIVRDWLASLTKLVNPRNKKPYAIESLNGHFRVLRAMLRDASADLDLPDPTRRVKALDNHEKGKRKSRTLSAKELAAFLSEVKLSEPRHYPMTVVAFLTGMRFGEYSALKWEDIMEDEGIILLRRSHYRGHLAATKNGEPRVAPLDEQGMIIGALREHRTWLLKLQTRKGLESGYVRGFAEGLSGAVKNAPGVAAKMPLDWHGPTAWNHVRIPPFPSCRRASFCRHWLPQSTFRQAVLLGDTHGAMPMAGTATSIWIRKFVS